MDTENFLLTSRNSKKRNIRISEADFRRLVSEHKELKAKVKQLEKINATYLRIIDNLTKVREC